MNLFFKNQLKIQ